MTREEFKVKLAAYIDTVVTHEGELSDDDENELEDALGSDVTRDILTDDEEEESASK